MTMIERHQTGTDEPTGRVRSLLTAAAAPTEPGPQPGESLALAAFRAAHPQERTRMLSRINPVRAALTTSAAALLLTGSLAAAAGALPGAAQDTAHEMLAKIGVTVPGPNEASDGHPDGRGSSGDTEDTTTSDEETTTEDESRGKGSEVSELATNPDLTGIEKGAAVSALASGGSSQAGQHGSAADAPGGAPDTAGRPDTAGKPDTVVTPDSAGRPDTAGQPDDAGRPDTAEKPDDAGEPALPGDQSPN